MMYREIQHAFGGKLLGKKMLKQYVCEVVVHLPEDMQHYLTQYCWFVGSLDDAWGYVFTGNDLADQHLIFLSDELFEQGIHQIYWSITHEIGHVMLGHKNNILTKQSKEQVKKQEKDADAFAAQFVW